MYGAHEERENRASSGMGEVWEKKKKRVLKPRGIARAGGDGVVGRAQAGGANAVQVRWWWRRGQVRQGGGPAGWRGGGRRARRRGPW